MKGKQLAILLALVVVLGGLGWYLQSGNRSAWTSSAAGTGVKVVNLPLNDVAQITIKSPAGEVNLARKNDAWVVTERGDYPADFAKVSDLLRVAWDLKTLQEVKVGPSQLGRLELLEPGAGAGAATLLEFKDKDGKRLEALLLGKVLRKESDPALGDMAQLGGLARGRYVKPVAGGAKVSLVSESFEHAEGLPEKWLEPTFFRAEELKAVTVAGPTDAQKWKLTRETSRADWKLEGAKPEEQVDASKVSALGFSYSNPSFVDVLPATAKPEETGLDKPFVATLETMDGLVFTLKIGKPLGENISLTVAVAGDFARERAVAAEEKPEDKTKLDDEFKVKLKKNEDRLAAAKKIEGRTFSVAKSLVEPLMRDRAALLAEKKPDAPATGSAAPALLNAPGATDLPSAAGEKPGSLPADVLEQLKKSMPPGTKIEAVKPAAPAEKK